MERRSGHASAAGGGGSDVRDRRGTEDLPSILALISLRDHTGHPCCIDKTIYQEVAGWGIRERGKEK